jgi:type IV pilus assembly protein PilV
LLEALIALVIFSVALLGLARMYTQMMSMSHSAYFRTLATIQANDLEERIRANPNGDYAGNCSDDPAAASDFQTWCDNTEELFGTITATVESVNSDMDYRIRLVWSERGLDNEEGNQSFEEVTFEYVVRK